MDRKEGIVKWFSRLKGYGFIKPDEGEQAAFGLAEPFTYRCQFRFTADKRGELRREMVQKSGRIRAPLL